MNRDNHTTRRSFIKNTSAAVAGAAMVGSLGHNAYAAGDDEIKIALIGCGGRGTGAAVQALKTKGKVRLIAMADVFRDKIDEKLNLIAKQFKKNPERVDVKEDMKFVGIDAFKKVMATDVDLVVLGTPPGFRPCQYEAAVKAGKHVFMEKPVAVDAPGIQKILDANKIAKEKNLKVGVGLQRRHQVSYLETIKQLQDGAIGDILFMQCYWNMGYLWVSEKKAGQSEMEYQLRNWLYFNWLSGDHIVEQHVHNIDVCNWAKDDVPIAAQGVGGRQVRTEAKYGEIFDHHMVEFRYKDGTKVTSQCRQIPNCWNRVSELAVGTKGSANISGARIKAEKKWRYRGANPNPYQREHDVLFNAVRNNILHNEADYGATSTMSGIMGRMATYSGKMIRYTTALKKGRQLMPEGLTLKSNPPVMPDANGMYAIPMPGKTSVMG